MPITSKTFFLACFAIAGIVPLSGFFSKDEILWHTFVSGNYILWGMAVITAMCTAFYMFRLYYLTFSGRERFDHHHVHPHESPLTMTLPLMVLAVLSAVAGFVGIPHVMGDLVGHIPHYLLEWLAPVFATANAQLPPHHGSAAMEWALMGFSLLVAATGIFLARRKYKESYNPAEAQPGAFAGFRKLLWNKYYVDEAYYGAVVEPLHNSSRSFLWKVFDVKIIDGIVNGSAELVRVMAESLRKMQTGIVQNYALLMIIGIVAVLGWLIVQF